jgi:hypothetical protein
MEIELEVDKIYLIEARYHFRDTDGQKFIARITKIIKPGHYFLKVIYGEWTPGDLYNDEIISVKLLNDG